MKLFQRRKTILETKNREFWKEAKLRLREGGIKSVHGDFYDSEPPVCG